MQLSIPEIRERLKNPKNRVLIGEAVAHELRLRFHSQIQLTQSDAGQAATDFLNWVKTLIPYDKFKIFCSFFRFPIPTVNTTEKIYSDLEKIFDGVDPVFSYTFTRPELSADYENYRTDSLDEPNVWRTRGFNAMRNNINSILIVDMPAESGGTMPEPYFYFLDVSAVIDFELKNGEIVWIAFEQKGDKVAVFDSEYYRVFNAPEGTKDSAKWTLEAENAHGLGYCPARFFWEDPVSYSKPAIKKSPISRHLSTLDRLLYFHISREHFENYAAYPIYVTFEQDCDYQSDEQGHYCNDGFLKDFSDNYVLTRGGTLSQCPKCAESKLAGAGSYIEVSPPSDENGNQNLIDAVKIISVDRSSLDYNTEELHRLQHVIHTDITGYDGEMMKNQAVNEKQVIAGFEGRSNILRNIKKNFESAQKWVSETICRLRYGDAFVSCSISYGENFYLYSADFILSMYQAAKENGLPSQVLDMLENQFYETKFRNNPAELKRKRLELHIDPFRHLTFAEVKDMYEKNQVSYADYMLKANLSSWLMRFERENTSINEFGNTLPLSSQVQNITNVLRTYIQPITAINQPSN